VSEEKEATHFRYGILARVSSLWKKPAACIFFEYVTKSGGLGRSHFSCAQNVPVGPTPVCTSSTIMKTPCFSVTARRPRKKAGEAWLSPPSAWMGSTISAATGFVAFCSTMVRSTSSSAFFSAASLCAAWSSSGYRTAGQSTAGHLNAGTSILWMALLRVRLRLPRSRPWKACLKERMERSGEPGASFFMQLDSSSGEKPTPSPRSLAR
jgi:hypothetical protein